MWEMEGNQGMLYFVDPLHYSEANLNRNRNQKVVFGEVK